MGFSFQTWIYIIVAAVIAVLSLAVKVQTSRLEATEAAYSAFKAQVAVLGEQAAKDAKTAEISNLASKKRADDENIRAKRDLAGLYDAYRSLRDQHAGSGILPAAAAGAADPDRTCFSRAALAEGLDRSDAILQEGAVGILQRGDQAIVDLETARGWARELNLVNMR